MYYLGIDLGGTNIVAGVVDENHKIIGKGKKKTNCPRPSEEIIDDMAAAARLAVEASGVDMSEIAWLGVGSPGIVNRDKGVIEAAYNLGFFNVPAAQMLKERLGLDVYLENDANAAAYGELIAGAGKGVKNFVAITIGTGVGGGVIVDGKMLSGFNCAGGELGHIVINENGEPCSCGRKGCWEAYASATALIRQTRAKMEQNRDSEMWKISPTLDSVDGRTAFDAMRAGDKAGAEVVDAFIGHIAEGVTNIINILRPEVLCIGGGISHEGETLLAPLREIVNRDSFGSNPANMTKLCAAELEGDAGLIGAAFLGNLQ